MANRYKYQIEERRGAYLVIPTGESDVRIQQSQKKNRQNGYTRVLTGDFTFTAADFKKLQQLEKSMYRCELIDLVVLTSADEEYFRGRINFTNGKWNEHKCTLAIAVDENTEYSCYDDRKSEEYDVYLNSVSRITLNLIEQGVTFEYLEYSTNVGCQGGSYWNGAEHPDNGGWAWYEHYGKLDAFGCDRKTKWVREVLTTDCAIDLSSDGWRLVEDNCPINKKWGRKPMLYNVQLNYTVDDPELGYFTDRRYYSIFGTDTDLQQIDNGMLLSEILNQMFGNLCEGKTVVSDFFQINPVNVSSTNYVTGQPTTTANILVFQKSDVKRPNDINNASKALVKLQEFIDALCLKFNLEWRINGDVVRFEHVSFWNKTAGIDLANPAYEKFVKGRNEYSYERAELPYRETFEMIENGGGDFGKQSIVYDNYCTDRTAEDRAQTITKITTDLMYCLDNPQSDSKNVTDDGLVFVACTKDEDDNYYIIRKAGIFSEAKVNNPFSFAHLINDFHRHNRPFDKGIWNSEPAVFTSVVPTKKGTTVAIPFPDNLLFDPSNYITNPWSWGNGIVQQARHRLKDCILELDILYDHTFNLTQNTAPIAVNDSVSTPIDTPVDADVLANDTDAENDIVGIVITVSPAHGTATIVDGKVHYVPDTGYFGMDQVKYQAVDSWGEKSNEATLFITVNADPTAPVANVDFYLANKDTVLNIAAPGVMVNDTDDEPGLTVDPDTITTEQGGTVVMNADGSFSYTPPVGYVGEDSFEYTLIDADSNTVTGYVSLLVRPVVYVRFVEYGVINTPITMDCPPVTNVGSSTKKSYRAEFYSDVAGTIPVNVTGFGISLTHHVETRALPSAPWNPNDYSVPIAGTSQVVVDNRTVFVNNGNCSGGLFYYYEETNSLLPGSGYIII